MFKSIWRCRVGRWSISRNFNLYHISSTALLKSKVHRSVISFQDNQNIDNPSMKDKISSYVIDFIKKETRVFANALINDGVPTNNDFEDIDDEVFLLAFSNLNIKIREELEKIVDIYNKFCHLLTYDPILIHPSIYISFYKKLKVPLDVESKILFLKRLSFHQQFDECWKTALTGTTTLNDIEDFLEVITDELESCGNLKFGSYYLLLASHNTVVNQSVVNTIVDTISYKFQIDKDDITVFFAFADELNNIETLEELKLNQEKNWQEIEKSIYLQSLYLRKNAELLQKSNMDLDFNKLLLNKFIHDVTQKRESIKSPGWISSVLPLSDFSYIPYPSDHKKVINTMSNKTEPRFVLHKIIHNQKNMSMNDYDFLHLLQNATPKNSYTFYQLYRRIHKKNIKKANPYIVNYLMVLLLEENVFENIFPMLMEVHSMLNKDVLYPALLLTFTNSKVGFRQIVRKIDKSNNRERKIDIFSEFINKLVAKPGNSITNDDVMHIIDSFYKTEVSSDIILVLLSHISKTNFDHNSCLKIFRLLITEKKFSSFVLLEVARCCILRNRILDEDLISPLFETILSRSFNKNIIMNKNMDRISKLSNADDFQSLYSIADAKERARFHNRIRSLGQCLSLLNAEELATVLNIFQRHLFSDDFKFIRSESGKNYILNNLIFDIMRFIGGAYRDNPAQGVLKMRDLLGNLNFSSNIAQCCLYKYMVKEDPLKSIKLLLFHQNKNSQLSKDAVRYIISGLLSSNKLDPKQKISAFRSFQSELQKLNYKYSISTHTAIELINIMLEVLQKDPHTSLPSVKWVLAFAKQKKVPRAIILNWAKNAKH